MQALEHGLAKSMMRVLAESTSDDTNYKVELKALALSFSDVYKQEIKEIFAPLCGDSPKSDVYCSYLSRLLTIETIAVLIGEDKTFRSYMTRDDNEYITIPCDTTELYLAECFRQFKSCQYTRTLYISVRKHQTLATHLDFAHITCDNLASNLATVYAMRRLTISQQNPRIKLNKLTRLMDIDYISATACCCTAIDKAFPELKGDSSIPNNDPMKIALAIYMARPITAKLLGIYYAPKYYETEQLTSELTQEFVWVSDIINDPLFK